MKRAALRRTSKARTPRDTGPSEAVRTLVVQRCRYLCERCGTGATGRLQIHHRKPRRMGGTRNPAINEADNLLLLCASCHLGGVEVNRLQAYREGFLLHAGDLASIVPVKIYGRGFVYLTRDGKYSAELRSD